MCLPWFTFTLTLVTFGFVVSFFFVKVAVTVVAALSVTWHVLVPEQPPPDQPVRCEPDAGVAVSVTEAPSANDGRAGRAAADAGRRARDRAAPVPAAGHRERVVVEVDDLCLVPDLVLEVDE